jgi:hypothetical protein
MRVDAGRSETRLVERTHHQRRRAAVGLVIAVACSAVLLVVIGAGLLWLVRPRSTPIPGADAEPVDSTSDLLSNLENAGVQCVGTAPFELTVDGTYLPQAPQQCVVDGGSVVFLVYRDQADRVEAPRVA